MIVGFPYGEEQARLHPGREIVALGYQVRDRFASPDPMAEFDRTLHWRGLVNEAEGSSMAEEFFVSGAQLKGVLTALLHEFGDGNVRPYVLWHSHWKLVGPSPFDKVHFPSWLVHIGAIYNVTHDTTTLYDETGLRDGDDIVRAPIAVAYGSMH